MLISVIVPTYNRASTLSRALSSVLAQSWQSEANKIEFVVVDDGSTDSTAELVASEFPAVRYLYQENKGVSAARNAGIEQATGDWIAFLDSDDEWLPNKLELQMALLESSGHLICHGEEIWIRNGKRVNQMNKHQKSGGWIFEKCLPLCVISPSSVVIHRSVFDQVGLFDESLPACEDYDLWLRISSRYEIAYESTACINKYGGHADQLSRQFWGMDRFRVQALEKALQAELSATQIAAAREMLLEKLRILLIGANKRDNSELIDYCEERISLWQS